MTPSQKTAIEKQKSIFSLIWPNAVYHIYTPNNTDIIRLVAIYKVKNYLGDYIQQSKAWSVGKRGKIHDNQFRGLK